MKFHNIDIDPNDLEIWIDGDLIKAKLKNYGGSFSGDTYAPRMWPM